MTMDEELDVGEIAEGEDHEFDYEEPVEEPKQPTQQHSMSSLSGRVPSEH
jgi:hypothetical protein